MKKQTTNKIRAAIYARVSTSDQNNALQVRELTEYCERRGWEVVEVFEDKMSGSKASRPALDRMMADARLRRFDVVLVWKLDRFGRSLMNCTAAILELTAAGVRFMAVSQGIDTDQSSPTSALLLNILASVAEFERAIIRERVSAGVRHAQKHGTKSGVAIGRPKRIFNHDEVARRRAAGASIEAIAREMGLGVGTVARTLAKAA